MNKTLLTILFVFSLFSAFAQERGNISGTIYSITDSAEIIGADIKLLVKDTDSVIIITSTSETGEFIFEEIPYNQYDMLVEYFGYPPVSLDVTLDKPEVNVGKINMIEDINLYKDIIIQADVIAQQQKGDTTELNADAYKVNPDATAEDLLRKMPGVDMSEGTPKVQGENVTKILVDGKPFFGDDVNSTMKNLPAEMIQNVQIYDERSEQSQLSGFDDGQTTKTINLITRENKRQGMFGKFYGGYGLNADDNYYNVGGTYNYFKGNQRITVLGMTNNINVQNFSSEDLSGGASMGGRGGGMAGGRRPGGGGNEFMVNQSGGITTTNAAGFNYTNQWSDKVKLTGSYFFNNSTNIVNQTTTREYDAVVSNGQRYDEDSRSTNEQTNHRFDARLEYQIDSNNYISFAPNLRIQNQNSMSSMSASTVDPLGALLSNSRNDFRSQSDNLNGSYRFLYNHNFKKPGRTISLSNNSGFNKTTGVNHLEAYNTFIDTTENQDLLQEADINRNGWNTYVNLNYTEPLNQFWKMQANAGFRKQVSQSDKETNDYNELNNQYDLLNSELSSKFESDYVTRFGGLAISYAKDKFQFNVGSNYQLAEINSETMLPRAYVYENTFQNLLPYASLSYNFSKSKSFRLRYSTSTNTPSITQLQDVIDNSNTLVLRSGNPNLDQNYDHRIFMNYRATNTINNSSLFAMMMLNITNNYVGNSTIIAEAPTTIGEIVLQPGMQFIKPVNLNGFYRYMAHAVYSFRLNPIKSNVNINGAYVLSNTPGLVNDIETKSLSTRYSLGANIGSNISEKIDFNIGSQFAYNTLENSFNSSNNNSFVNLSTRFDLNYYITSKLFYNTQLNHQSYSGLYDGYNQNFILWNMALGYKFLKNNAAEIKLSVFDLLKQNRAIVPTQDQFYTQVTTSNVLQQYFMLTFTYNLRKFSSNSSEKDFQKEGGFDQRGGPGGPPHPGQPMR